MFSSKIGWIIPFIVLFILFSVIAVGIYQLNTNGNPWFFGKEPVYHWEFLDRE